ncbi:MAG: hypothetical protein LDLANPLL_01454 [Turneriella sp.]|nr:hypothetical protein [Turneriella sp.]
MKSRIYTAGVLSLFIGCAQVPLAEKVIFQKAGFNDGGIYINPSSGTTSEAGGAQTIGISLTSKPTATVTLTISSSNTAEGQIKHSSGTCDTAGTVVAASCILTFTDADYLTPKNISMVGQNDNVVDAGTAYKLQISASSADPLYTIAQFDAASLTNTDNDTADFVATPSSGLVTRPSGGSATATSQIKLSSQPSADVTFLVKSTDTNGGDVTTPAGKSFTFTNANWNVNQPLVVTGGSGSTPLDYKIVIDGTITSADPNYNGKTGTVLHTGISLKNIAAGDKYIFFTTAGTKGDFGGASSADTKCNAEAVYPTGKKPNSSTYKAILGGGGRTACTTANCGGGAGEHTDWVLLPNQSYTRQDGTPIGTTNANGIFTFPLTSSIGGSSSSWTGLKGDWTTWSNCSNWASTSGNGSAGRSGNNDSTAIYEPLYGGGFGLPCSSMYPLYCAEQ